MNDKHRQLLALLDGYCDRDLIVAFSGGVDSSLLAAVARERAAKKQHIVHAVTFQTTLHPVQEITETTRIAAEIGVVHHILPVDELAEAGVQDNPVDRCYRCKKFLFQKLREMALSMDLEIIMDGTNADDLKLHRPGLRAIRELGVISPLAEAALNKNDVRQLAKLYGLSVADRPSNPCLATRFPYGTTLSSEIMRKVEKGEVYLRSLGFYNVRLRVHGDIARIEVDREDLVTLLQLREQIVSNLKQLGYGYVTVDLEGFRSGSMDI